MIVGAPVITLTFSVLSAALVLVGGIVLFVAGRSRGALAGAGFVALAIGTVLGSLLATFAPLIVDELDVSPPGFAGVFTIVQLLFDLIGWGLIIMAVVIGARPAPKRPPLPPDH